MLNMSKNVISIIKRGPCDVPSHLKPRKLALYCDWMLTVDTDTTVNIFTIAFLFYGVT
jgi:hypothetical protein